MRIEPRYINGDYAVKNPSWDVADSEWKANHIINILDKSNINLSTIADVGCGAGVVSHFLAQRYPNFSFTGFDVSPQLPAYWSDLSKPVNLNFSLSDFSSLADCYDLILLIDVLEHLRDPLTFIETIAPRSKYFLFHLPLDLSAFSVIRSSPLLSIRSSVGHLQASPVSLHSKH